MPTIERVSVVALEYPIARGRGYGSVRGIHYRRSCSVVRLVTSDGIEGHGEIQGPTGIVGAYVTFFAPLFEGRGLFDFNLIVNDIRNRLYHFGSQGHFLSCLGGINIAIQDAIGQTLKVPVHDLLGGRTGERLACYATTGYFTDHPEAEVAAQLSRLDLSDFAGVKIKIGSGVEQDVARVREARAAIGDSKLLMVDYNANYTSDVALESLRKIAPYGIHWCEEPLHPADLRGYAELRARSPIPVGAGEAHFGIHDFRALIENRCLDIVQLALTSSGGFEEMKAVAMLAVRHNLRVSLSCWGGAIAVHAAAHLAASIPIWPHADNPLLVEYDVGENPLRESLAVETVRPANGTLPVPKGAGLGIRLDRACLARHTVGG